MPWHQWSKKYELEVKPWSMPLIFIWYIHNVPVFTNPLRLNLYTFVLSFFAKIILSMVLSVHIILILNAIYLPSDTCTGTSLEGSMTLHSLYPVVMVCHFGISESSKNLFFKKRTEVREMGVGFPEVAEPLPGNFGGSPCPLPPKSQCSCFRLHLCYGCLTKRFAGKDFNPHL